MWTIRAGKLTDSPRKYIAAQRKQRKLLEVRLYELCHPRLSQSQDDHLSWRPTYWLPKSQTVKFKAGTLRNWEQRGRSEKGTNVNIKCIKRKDN